MHRIFKIVPMVDGEVVASTVYTEDKQEALIAFKSGYEVTFKYVEEEWEFESYSCFP